MEVTRFKSIKVVIKHPDPYLNKRKVMNAFYRPGANNRWASFTRSQQASEETKIETRSILEIITLNKRSE